MHGPHPGNLQLVGRGLSPDLKWRRLSNRHFKSPPGGRERQLGAGSAGTGSGKLVPGRSHLGSEPDEKEVRYRWGGEGPSLDLDGALPGVLRRVTKAHGGVCLN